MNRRKFMSHGLLLGGMLFGMGRANAETGLAAPNAENYADTLKRLFNHQNLLDSDQVSLTLPHIAEDGAVVPISFDSKLNDIQRVYVLVEKNPLPLTAVFEFASGAEVFFSGRIKMAESSQVIAVAQQGEQLLRCSQWVNITQGGCGTG